MDTDNTGNIQVSRLFKPGKSGNPNGRPKGARNKLTEVLMRTVVEDFVKHGAEALKNLRESDPATYFKLMVAILPKSVIEQYEAAPSVDYADLSQEEIIELVEDSKRRQFVEKALITVTE